MFKLISDNKEVYFDTFQCMLTPCYYTVVWNEHLTNCVVNITGILYVNITYFSVFNKLALYFTKNL